MNNPNETMIIKRIKDGEIDNFEYLVKKYSKIILRFVKRKVPSLMDTDDIVQNVFIKGYKSIDRFDETKPFYPFLFTITKREIAQYFREKIHTVPLDESILITENNEDTSDHIKIFLNRLKPDFRKVLQLQLAGYSYHEISKKLNKPINTIKTLIRRAKLSIKNYDKK